MKILRYLQVALLIAGCISAGTASGQDTLYNGYQRLVKSQATGSFELITAKQLQHSSDPDLAKRLEGIVNSLNFNTGRNVLNSANSGRATLSGQYRNSTLQELTVRGKNTIGNTSSKPLVVIDGVTNPYSIDYLQPENVESITFLKDGAAASIYGIQGANGVIVVRTKRGAYKQTTSVTFQTNFNFSDKPDAFYRKTMSTSEFVDAQVYQFNAANTVIAAPNLVQPQPFYSPVAELLNSGAPASQIDALKSNDIRNDFNKYLFRKAGVQSYTLNVSGGSKRVSQHLFAGYDQIKNNTYGADESRVSLAYNMAFKLLDNLELTGNLNVTGGSSHNRSPKEPFNGTLNTPFYLYTRLTDDSGNPQRIPYQYRTAFTDLLASNYGFRYLLPLDYNPLNNVNEGSLNTTTRNYNLNVGAKYKLTAAISASVLYNYNKSQDQQNILNTASSFYMRDLYDFYTNMSRPTAPVFNLPAGGVLQRQDNQPKSNLLRAQLNFDKNWNTKNSFSAIAGFETTGQNARSIFNNYYGYDKDMLTVNNTLPFTIPVVTLFSDPNGSTTSILPNLPTPFAGNKVRTSGVYGTANYAYDNKYSLSATVRDDLSSAYDHHATYYSIGVGWNIAGESFYKFSWLPLLRLRSSYGTSGATNISSIYTKYYQPKPDESSMFNAGLDFGLKNNRISGSVEYYNKKSTDLFARNGIDAVTGMSNAQVFNRAKLYTDGIDLSLNSLNLQRGQFSWTSNLLLAWNRTKVASPYGLSAGTAGEAITGTAYAAGYDVSQIFAFKWAGLDGAGNPRGYINAVPAGINTPAAYASVANQSVSTARYFGSATPTTFGFLRNTFSYGAFSFSANIQYKLGYYFRRPVSELVQYSALFNGAAQGAEFSNRWQKAGDERITNVPSMVYPANVQRDNFYRYSEINVLKADHVRLQELNFGYTLNKKTWALKNARIYVNVSNLGMIWKANKAGLDPDVYDYPNPRTYAIGLSAGF